MSVAKEINSLFQLQILTLLHPIPGVYFMEKTMEIFREDGIEFTSIRTNFGADGTLSINGQDMGPMVEQFWGDDDYEYFLSIPKKSIEMFLLHLMKLAFNTEKKITFGDCKEILEVNKIEHAFNWWA